jgi:hypothetical protein
VSDIRIYARDGEAETDITEGVQALYDLVIGSMNWGSGFWTAEDAAPVAKLARACGFERAEEAERYLNEQLHSEEQKAFLLTRLDWRTQMMAPHDHVFSSAGKCLWPGCKETGTPETGRS